MAEILPQLPERLETVAELRQLYRDAEARAARLRFVSRNGRDLAGADASTIDRVLIEVALRLAHFLGRLRATVVRGPEPKPGLPMPAPGDRRPVLGHVLVDGIASLADVADAEDRDLVSLQLEQMGLAIDRVEREQRLEEVIGRLFTAQEEERRRVSHELHDGVAQTATALVRMLEGPVPDTGRLAAIARGLVVELRQVIGGLRPPQLDDLGLEAALRALADELRSAGYDVEVGIGPGTVRWSLNAETALYRVAQEALTNIRKHAGSPCRVEIALEPGLVGTGPCLTIRDHGIGCTAPVASDSRIGGTSIGIAVMRERMAALGGRLHWSSAPGCGVTVIAELPSGGA